MPPFANLEGGTQTKKVILALVLVFVAPCIARAGLNDGLVTFYPFDGDANEFSGQGNNPTYVGATLTQDRFGNPESTYSFGGRVGDFIQVPNSASINVNTVRVNC